MSTDKELLEKLESELDFLKDKLETEENLELLGYRWHMLQRVERAEGILNRLR